MGPVTEEEARASFGGRGTLLEELVRSLASRRETPIRVEPPVERSRLGVELARWIDLFERHELEVADPGYAELRAPGEKVGLFGLVQGTGRSWIADLIGAFSAASVIAQEDEMSFLASWAGTEDGASRVYYFHPADWGLWPTEPSIVSRLFRMVLSDDRGGFPVAGADAARLEAMLGRYRSAVKAEALPSHLDPVRLFPRTRWLVHALLGVGGDLAGELAKAPSHAEFEVERGAIPEWPHLASYWIWAHFFLGNRDSLGGVIEASRALSSEVVDESKELVLRLERGQSARLGRLHREGFLALREEIRALAPPELLEPRARLRLPPREEVPPAEEEALAGLEEAARTDARTREALVLLEHLARGGATAPGPAPVEGAPPVDEAIARLAALVDDRFRPVVLGRLARAAEHGDSHRAASFGLLEAWASLARDLEEFDRVIQEIGTASFGPRRLREMYRAYGRFQDRRATEVLARGARAFLAELDDWIRMSPPEPLLLLLARDTLETHEIIARVLEGASFSPANVGIAVRVAEAAGELKSKRSIPGLVRAVKARLGRVEDGGRSKVVRALYHAGGRAGGPLVRELLESEVPAWEASRDEHVSPHRAAISCFLSGLLPMDPEDARAREVARAVLSELLVECGPRRAPRAGVVESARAILLGIRLGQVRALEDAVAPFSALGFRELHAGRGARNGLMELARAVCAEL